MAHGSGGRLSQQLISNLLLPQFRNEFLDAEHDGAVFSVNGTHLAFSTDSFVVNPIFFPGGDIGKLAINGTVNEIADIHVLRDPTRGGVTSALTEIARKARVGIFLNEAQIPISEEVKGACEILGLDPLYVANEGKLLAIVSADEADPVLSAMRAHPLGKNAAAIGTVTEEHRGLVFMKTRIGGTRIVDMLSGEQLPRIC